MIITDEDEIINYKLEQICNKIVLGDALKVLPKIPAESVDLVFVDPPYFLQLPSRKLIRWGGTQVKGVIDDWDKFRNFPEYDNFTIKWLSELQRIMKPKATIWVIGTYHNIHRIGKIMQDLNYWILADVQWVKSNPVPNFLGVRFTNATETLIWAVKNRNVKGHVFNKQYAKQYGIGKVGANVWVIPVCSGRERLKDPTGVKIHSTQKPVELIKRIIQISTNPGDLIIDPMAGTGTTGFVAHTLQRNFIMVEKNHKYTQTIPSRFNTPLENESSLNQLKYENNPD
jgi:DNA modification methylase